MTVAKTRPLLIATSVFALLAGCEDTLKRYGEAGSPPAYYGLGSSVDMNAGYHTGDYVFDFAQRFHDTVPDTVNFAFNSAVLDAEAQAVLRKQAHFIRQFPEVRWKVYGHTDLVGSNAYNQRLGLRRAQAVVAYLASQGVNPQRMVATGFGETRPIADNSTDAGRAQNRRVEIQIVPLS